MNWISGFGLSLTQSNFFCSNLIYKSRLFSDIFEKMFLELIDNEITGKLGERSHSPFPKRKGNLPIFSKDQTLPTNCADFTVWGPLIEILFACC